MGKEILTYDDLLQIVQLIKSAEAFSEFHLKIGDIELDVRKANGAAPSATFPTSGGSAIATAAPASAEQAPAPAAPAPAAVAHAAGSAVAPSATTGRGAAARTVEIPAGCVAVRSPMVGTFYKAPEPGARPFVEVGQRVEPDTIVCIIEVMKLMNSIPAGTSGVVRDVLASDAEPVDAGQVIIVIDPKGRHQS